MKPLSRVCVLIGMLAMACGQILPGLADPGYLDPVPAPGHPPANNHHPADTCNPNYIAECRTTGCVTYSGQLCFWVYVSINGVATWVHVCVNNSQSYRFISSGNHWPRCYLKQNPKQKDCYYHWKSCGYWVTYNRPGCAGPAQILEDGYIQGCDP